MNDPNENMADEPIDKVKVMENVQAVNAAMKASVTKKDFEALAITDDDIAKFLKVVPSLDSMEEAISYLGGDEHVTASLVLPFLISFNTSLEADENDSQYVGAFKQTLKDDLMRRCATHLNLKMLIRASYFDKRFSNLEFVSKLGFLSTYLEDDNVFNKNAILEEIQ